MHFTPAETEKLLLAVAGMVARDRLARGIPLNYPEAVAFISAAILVFIFSLGFYITPALLGGGKTIMIAEYIALQITDTLNWGVGTMLASTLLITVFLILAVMARIVDLRHVFGIR